MFCVCIYPTRLLTCARLCVRACAYIRGAFIQRGQITTHSSCVSHHLLEKFKSVVMIFFSSHACLNESKYKHPEAKNKLPCGFPDLSSGPNKLYFTLSNNIFFFNRGSKICVKFSSSFFAEDSGLFSALC